MGEGTSGGSGGGESMSEREVLEKIAGLFTGELPEDLTHLERDILNLVATAPGVSVDYNGVTGEIMVSFPPFS